MARPGQPNQHTKQSKIQGSVVLNKLLRDNRRHRVLEGSTGSTKTYSINQWIDYQLSASKVPLVARAFRTDAVDCKQAVGKDFEKIMQMQAPKLWDGGKTYNKQDACFTYPHNGSRYYFCGTDAGRLPGYRQHIAFLDETTRIGYDAWRQIDMRTSHTMLYAFNPEAVNHWIFSRILDGMDPKYVQYIHSTYKDNKHLTKDTIRAIEETNPALGLNTADPWYWQVYGLGKRARREGVVYERWDTTEDWPERSTCQRYGYGLDFGFSIDPSTLIECALHQNFLYVREVFYKKGLTTLRSLDNKSIPCIQNELEIAEVPKYDKIMADCANPEPIKSLQNCGYNVSPCKKGKGSVVAGIDKVRQFHLKVDLGSQNIQNELANYVWKRDDRKNETFNEPVDKHNHALDAIRYWATEELDQTEFVGRSERIKELMNLEFESDW